MEGFLIEINQQQTTKQLFHQIIQTNPTRKEEVIELENDNHIHLVYTSKYNFYSLNEEIQHKEINESKQKYFITTISQDYLINKIQTTSNRIEMMLQIDKELSHYLLIEIHSTGNIYFNSDRFTSCSLLYELVNDSIVLSNLQCPNTCEPQEWYSYNINTNTFEKKTKNGETIEEYYDYLFGKRMEHPLENVDEAVEQLRLTLSNATKMLMDDSNDPIPVLFSGGIDSSVVAYFVLEHCGNRPVELYNMSCRYENTFDSPDRLCAKAVLADLQRLYPNKTIHFVEVNIESTTAEDISKHLIPIIYPNDTVMDLSITSATCLALTQEGVCNDVKMKRTVQRIFCGQGADEQLGGYGRHRNALKFNKLTKELDLDFCRLWSRNSSRDDRLNDSCHALCLNPFLHEDVIRTIRNIPEHLLVKLELPENEGNKWILREMSRKIDMIACSAFKKTAIQFGTRMAKVLNKGKKVSGADKLN